MPIRSTAKAIVLHDGKLLLNRCRDRWHGEYYTLPGGGQETYETMAETLIRECREETGYAVCPGRFAALCEEICDDPDMRERYPAYAHKMLHIFLCSLASERRETPTEVDDFQLGCEWVEIGRLSEITLLPAPLGAHITELVNGGPPLFLGSAHLEHNHA